MSHYNWPEIMSKKENSEPKEKVDAALNELKNRGIESEKYYEIF